MVASVLSLVSLFALPSAAHDTLLPTPYFWTNEDRVKKEELQARAGVLSDDHLLSKKKPSAEVWKQAALADKFGDRPVSEKKEWIEKQVVGIRNMETAVLKDDHLASENKAWIKRNVAWAEKKETGEKGEAKKDGLPKQKDDHMASQMRRSEKYKAWAQKMEASIHEREDAQDDQELRTEDANHGYGSYAASYGYGYGDGYGDSGSRKSGKHKAHLGYLLPLAGLALSICSFVMLCFRCTRVCCSRRRSEHAVIIEGVVMSSAQPAQPAQRWVTAEGVLLASAPPASPGDYSEHAASFSAV